MPIINKSMRTCCVIILRNVFVQGSIRELDTLTITIYIYYELLIVNSYLVHLQVQYLSQQTFKLVIDIMKMTRLSTTTEITSEVAQHFTARILISHVFIQAFSLAATFLNLQ